MTDPNERIYRAAAHEVSHSLMQYLLSGAFGGIEIKATEPGNGRCWTTWPSRWRDEGAKFWIFTGFVDAAGIEGERLLCKATDAQHSADDLVDLSTAAQELLDISTDYRSGTVGELVSLFREMAAHLLARHTPPLEYLAGRASGKRHWLGGDIEMALLTMFPEYRDYRPLFEGHWAETWVSMLDDLNTALERKFGWISPTALRKLEMKVKAIGAERRMRS